MSFIQLNDIVKEFHDQVRETKTLAIDRVSLSVEKKEFVCLIGPSGCGKTHSRRCIGRWSPYFGTRSR